VSGTAGAINLMTRPNVVVVFADQLRYQAVAFTGDPNVRTPRLDALAGESLQFTTAVSGCPVCSPARASLITGQYPLTHGVFLNDVCLGNGAPSLAEVLGGEGYDTAYIGKWHLDGHGRRAYIPRERRHGFDFWRARECTHDYAHSSYYADDDPTERWWDGYDAVAQTRAAQAYIRDKAGGRPFLLMLSWGPPHAPYDTAPHRFRAMYDPAALVLRPNVPPQAQARARADLAGYYAHVTALDELVGDLAATLDETGIADDTVLVFWSDHGDMLGSQGQRKKQRPWDESIRVPLLLRYPRAFGRRGRRVQAPVNTPDLMPTLLDLAAAPCPDSVEGTSYAPHLRGEVPPPAAAALIACYHPFGQFLPAEGGREYRGVRTARYTYVCDRSGPWLLYDNQTDPFQQHNLISDNNLSDVRRELHAETQRLMAAGGDEFAPGMDYVRRWGHRVDANGTASTAD
jgi:arylsulfatase A-like enzyme